MRTEDERDRGDRLQADTEGISSREESPTQSPRPSSTEPTQTISPGDASVRELYIPGEVELPAQFGRFRIDAVLGTGGMGRVYKAFDPDLNRTVALKVLRYTDPELIQRFFQEARAQARVEHPHVCRVYEVGTVDAHPYIAMQYVNGPTLAQVGQTMSLEEMLRVMCAVAEGVHAAHRNGLIHRDIKPTNILVERDEDGQWQPYITDFGLARQIGTTGLTQTGMAIGTPEYMSPEQAAGRITQLDRRTDVWGLGATLYSLLVGRPPFTGESSLDVLRRILEEDPVPPRRLRPHIPVDVERIVLKCLEKDPNRRYPSARALAEDLMRYLNGEPVLARPPSRVYRWWMKIRKHRIAATLILILGLGMVVSSGWGLYNLRMAMRRAEIARMFGQRVERIEAFARYMYLLPPHDTRPDRRRIRSLMTEIEAQREHLGYLAAGIAEYALGRGYAILRNYPRAWRLLQQAWESGWQTPDLAYYLGWVGSEIYRTRLAAVQQIRDRDLRERRRHQLERTWKPRLQMFLQRARRAPDVPIQFVNGLLAFVFGDYARAVRYAEAAYRRANWMHEALKLKGDAYRAWGDRAYHRGMYDRARTLYRQAAEAYTQAARVGSSDVGVYLALCSLRVSQITMAVRQTGEDIRPYAVAGESDCRRATEVLPNDGDVYRIWSQLHARLGEHALNVGADPRPHLQRAIQLARTAQRWNPRDGDAYREEGTAHLILAMYTRYAGGNPNVELQRALQAFQQSVRIEPDEPMTYNNMGIAYLERGRYRLSYGQDPQEDYQRAVRAFRRVIRLDPAYALGWNNLGLAYFNIANRQVQRGEDPRDALRQAIRTFQRALQLHPNDVLALSNRGIAFAQLAKYTFAHGGDPQSHWESAITHFEKVLKIYPNDADTWNNLGLAYRGLAEFAMVRGNAPESYLQKARAAYQKALTLHPNDAIVYQNLGALYVLEAEWTLSRNADPIPVLDRARAVLEKAITIRATHYRNYQHLAEVALLRVRWLARQGRDTDADWQRVCAALDKAAQLNPKDAVISALRAAWYRWQVELRAGSADQRRAWVRAGLDAVAQALEQNPQYLHAWALRGILRAWMARLVESPEERAAWLRQARADLEKALQANPHLQWWYPLEEVQEGE